MGARGGTSGARERSRLALPLAALALLAPCLGCLYYGDATPRPPPASEARGGAHDPHTVSGYFAYSPLTEVPRVLETTEGGRATEQRLRFATADATFHLPQGRAPGAVPAVVVLPISKGEFHARFVAGALTSRGFATLRFQPDREILRAAARAEDPLGQFVGDLRAYVVDVLRAIDWLAAHPSVDAGRIGLLGLSFGALTASIVSGLDPRVEATVLILGGGDLPGIFLSSEETSVARIRERLAADGLTGEELRRELRERLRPFEPLRYAGYRDPSTILMLNARFDQVIERRHAMALWNALGEPPLVEVPAGHYSAIVFLPYAAGRARRHFERVVGGRAPSP